MAFGTTSGPRALASLVAAIGTNARATTVEDAATFGDVVLVAIPFGRYETLPADRLAGKIVVDAMNYYPPRDGQLDMGPRTSSELVARHLSGARLVKAFNTLPAERLRADGRPGSPIDDRVAIFVAGDDTAAKALVAHLIEEIGFASVDMGALHAGGRRQQPNSYVYNVPLTARQARGHAQAARS